jgi:hypothetical protein
MQKASTFLTLLISAVAFSVVSSAPAYTSVAADTIILYANPLSSGTNTIDRQILSDTLKGGVLPPNTVFVLQQTGTIDTVYYVNSLITVGGNITLIGKPNPKTGNLPVVATGINSDNSSPWTFFNPNGFDTTTLKNLYLLGTRSDGLLGASQFFYANGDSCTLIVDHCVVENFSNAGSGTPNIAGFWNNSHANIYVTNTEFRNNQDDVPQNPGFTWVDPTAYPCDNAVFKNNTFFIMGGTLIGSAGYIGNVDIEHNTVFLQTKGGIFTVPSAWNVTIKNNVFFSVNSTGLDTGVVNEVASQNANFYGPPAVIELDTLSSSLEAAPYNLTEAGRKIVVTNNAYFWPAGIVNNWKTVNNMHTKYGVIVPPVWLAQTGANLVGNKTKWPGINIANNDSTDPGFNATLVAQAADSMAVFIDTCWNEGTGANIRPYWMRQSDPPDFSFLPSGWTWGKGGYAYPVRENLRYSNTALQTAGDDGKALGDLNWFPEQVGVHQTPDALPTKFDLSQNYPNPFNPTTNIKVSLTHSGTMSLTIYNVLGQVVQLVDQGYKLAGEYTYNVGMDKFSSGVYFYKLQQGTNSITKKMVLLK